MNKPSSNPEHDLSGLTQGQLNVLDYLYKAGPEGVDIFELFKKSDEIGFTPNEQADLVMRGLWKTKKGNKIVHPEFGE